MFKYVDKFRASKVYRKRFVKPENHTAVGLLVKLLRSTPNADVTPF
jgi:hypothetical protein